jgi:hypothetical protein
MKVLTILLFLLPSSLAVAQCPKANGVCAQGVPRLLKFSGTSRDPAGRPRTGNFGITFSIYGDSSGGASLWQETQNVQLDSHGRYTVLLGASTSDGIPLDVFTSGEPRWIAAQVLLPGEEPQPRILLVSVPYALRAADAETLGGLPASAFARVAPSPANQVPLATVPTSVAATGKAGAVGALDTPVSTPGGTTDAIPKFSVSPIIIDSQITDTNGVVSLKNLANIFFADQFPDGVPGAVAACPPEGCTIYAGSKSVNRNLGTIDPGDKVITIYLGPFTYNVKQIVLRKSLRIIGMGASFPGTILQSVNGENPVIVIPQINVPVTNVTLSGLRIVGSHGNNHEDAIFLDSSNLVNTGLWYSELRDLYISDFAGIGIHLRGPISNFGSETQWVQFNNVVVERTLGGGNALRIEGANFQLHFTNCEFEGQAMGDGTNVYIGGMPGQNFSFPFDITFRGTVSEAAAVAFQIDGAATITFQTSHHEQVWGAYLITGNNGTYTRGVSIADSVFNPNVGVNNGAGFLLKVATTLAQGIYFMHNRLGGVLGVSAPDSVVSATNLAQVVYQDNEYFGNLDVPPTSGITTQISAASTINIGGSHTIGLFPDQAGTPVSTIQSTLGPGETVTFAALNGSVAFATGGNIALPGATSVTVSGTITFIRNDLSGTQGQWWPVSQWNGGSLTKASPDFKLSTNGASASVTAGGTATYNLNTIPIGNFSGTIEFSCVGAAQGSNCKVSPNPVLIDGKSPMTESVVIATAAPTSFSKSPLPPWSVALGQSVGPVFGMLMLVSHRTSRQARKRRRRHKVSLVALVSLIIPLLGCGAITTPIPPQGGTPSGTYALIVTGVSGSIRHSITLTLTVL